MSRSINTRKTTLSEDDLALQSTQKGKLLFTKVRNRLCALLIQKDRLTAARIFPENAGKIGAIYLGKVKNVVKNIDACFVEIAEGEICFLPMKDAKDAFLTNRIPDGRILEGDELLVQIVRDAQKTKQVSVTAQISISNEVFAISLGKPGVGYSGKLSKEKKEELKAYVKQQNLLKELNPFKLSVGMVIRTKAGALAEEEWNKSFREISTDWVSLFENACHRTCFTCLREAPADFEAVLQQLVYPYEYEEIITDNQRLYQKLTEYIARNIPEKKVRLYEDESFPLTRLYALESKISTALEPRVWLKSGGYLVIEPTEALTVIDVNSGKYEAKKSNQEAIYRINCEAAEEIALQLRLRNLSGIIVADFINMESQEHREALLELLRKFVYRDKQRTMVVDMTPLGLVEITRKKEYKPLHEQLL